MEVALVTGGGSGIGRAASIRLAKRGAHVAVFDLSAEGIDETARLINGLGGSALPIQGDVTDDGQVREAINRVIRDLGPLRTTVACAGVEVLGTVPDMQLSDWHRVIAVNVTGVFFTARFAIPEIVNAGGGSFVAMSSDAGVQGVKGFAAYSTSKHAVVGLVRSLALDHGHEGVRCNAVAPGFVETPMADRIFEDLTPEEVRGWADLVPLGRFAKADEIAEAIAYLTSEESAYINGQVHTIDGGATAGYFSV